MNTTTMSTILFSIILLLACNSPASPADASNQSTADTASLKAGDDAKLADIKLPPGFSISYYAEDVKNARSMELSPSGVLYVGTRDNGHVYALKDENADGKADKRWTLASGLQMPNGVAFKDGDLYVAEVSESGNFLQSNPIWTIPKRNFSMMDILIKHIMDGSTSPLVRIINYMYL